MPDDKDANQGFSTEGPPGGLPGQGSVPAETPWDEVQLREALMARHPTATRLLVEDYGLPVFRILRRKYRWMREEDLDSASHDALLAVIDSPEKFDPCRGSLLNYLVHIGNRRAIDKIRSDNRRPEIVLEESVEDRAGSANNQIGSLIEMRVPLGEEFSLNDLSFEMCGAILAALPDSRDQALLALMCERERSTAKAAAVLGISHLSVEEQRREVKRNKDRIRVHLRRLGLLSGESDETA